MQRQHGGAIRAHQHHSRFGETDEYKKLREQMWEDVFWYSGSFGNITVSGGATPSAVSQIQVQNDADFEWLRTTAYSELSGFTAPLKDDSIPQLTLLLQDAGSGRMLMDRAIPLSTICGTGRLPYLLPISRIFKGNSVISATVTNLSAANAYNNVFVVFHGRKIFYKG